MSTKKTTESVADVAQDAAQEARKAANEREDKLQRMRLEHDAAERGVSVEKLLQGPPKTPEAKPELATEPELTRAEQREIAESIRASDKAATHRIAHREHHAHR